MKNKIRLFLNVIACLWCEARMRLRELRGYTAQLEQQQQTATWPPVANTTTGFAVKGKTTIQWGTDGILSSPYPGSGFYTVTRCNQKPILERTKLPNGTGITTSDIILQDGVTWEITVRDDSGMTPPVVNTAVTLVDVAGLLGTQGLTYTARVVDPSYDTGLKQAGERVLACDNLVLIDSQSGSAQTAR